jgi:hypothetical protein
MNDFVNFHNENFGLEQVTAYCAEIPAIGLTVHFFQTGQAGKAGASDIRVCATLEPPAGRTTHPA